MPGNYEIQICKHGSMKLKGIPVPSLINIYDSISMIKTQAKDPGFATVGRIFVFSMNVSAGSKMAQNDISCNSRWGLNKNNEPHFIQK